MAQCMVMRRVSSLLSGAGYLLDVAKYKGQIHFPSGYWV